MKKFLLAILMVILSISAFCGTGKDKFDNLYKELRPYITDYLEKGKSSETDLDDYFTKILNDEMEVTAADFITQCKLKKMDPNEVLSKIAAGYMLGDEEASAELEIKLTPEEAEEVIGILQELVQSLLS
jgi:hypothetical protein